MRQQDNLIGLLILVTFSICCVFLIYVDALSALPWIAAVFRGIGFHWPAPAGEQFGTVLLLSFIFMAAYLFIKAKLQGWPEFQEHDEFTLRQSIVRLIAYGSLAFLGIGLFGSRLSEFSLADRPFDLAYVAIVALIFSGVLVPLNDLLGAIYQNFLKGERKCH
jgi:hypothetical protein